VHVGVLFPMRRRQLIRSKDSDGMRFLRFFVSFTGMHKIRKRKRMVVFHLSCYRLYSANGGFLLLNV
jgi:hypothetical protein